MATILIRDEGQLDTAADEFVSMMDESKVYAFYGEMGVGKTTFIKAVCRNLEVTDIVSSPTFALVYEYFSKSMGPIYHFDLYRIKDLEELYDMGYEDYFYSGNLCFIEWPELAEELLPEETMKVRLEKNPDGSRSIFI